MDIIFELAKNLLVGLGTWGITYLWCRRRIKVKLKVRKLYTQKEKEQNAKKGLIFLLSLYSQSRLAPEQRLSPEELERALREKDYQKLYLEKSPLGHNIEAVLTHQHNLKHCWIVGSCANNSHIPCSLKYEDVLVEYLRRERGLSCEFHYGEDYAISLDEDSLVCEKTYDMTNDIFKEAKNKHQLKSKDIIIDVTGGIRNMNLGMVLACLHKDQDIQIIGSKYDAEAQLKEQPYPIRIHFTPRIRK